MSQRKSGSTGVSGSKNPGVAVSGKAGPGRPALGRGLSALLPRADGTPARGLLTVPIDQLRPETDQPRQRFESQALQELSASIRSRGVLQPILVRRNPDGQYRIIAGERRWRASRLAGLTEVPVVVKEISESEVFEVALIENIQREDLSPIEEAQAYQRLLSEHGLTQEELASRVGKERSTIANSLRLLKLPDPVKGSLLAGDISVGHAKVLLGLDDEALMEKVTAQIAARGMSVRETEKLVQRQRSQSKPQALPDGAPESLQHLALQLEQALRHGCEVRMRPRGGGELTIRFRTAQDGEALITKLLSAAAEPSKS